MTGITVLTARKIITMNGYCPDATHVAIRDRWVLGVGSAADLAGGGASRVDDRFAGKVLMPGFVEGHCHAKEGGVWDHPYTGDLDRTDPDGKLWPGADSMAAVVARLSKIERGMGDAGTPLFAWGFDPIYFGGIRERDLIRFGQAAANCGVTTATDLFATFTDRSLAAYRAAASRPGYPLRLMPAMNTLERPAAEGIALWPEAVGTNTDKLRFGPCKIMTDGSIQGMSARMKWPGYYNGMPNGVWNMAPEQLREVVMAYHQAGWRPAPRYHHGPGSGGADGRLRHRRAAGGRFRHPFGCAGDAADHRLVRVQPADRLRPGAGPGGADQHRQRPAGDHAGGGYTLKMDHLVGSIETGKFADFAVLDDDPTAVAPKELRHVGVWGTITGGEPTPATGRADG